MVINQLRRTIGYKIVYYGPAMGGKTTNLRYIAQHAADTADNFISLETRGERTLYFDMAQMIFGEIAGYKTYFNLYTTPGQTVYIASRKLVLQGADAVVFVVDSQQSRLRDNVQSWYTLERQLLELSISRYRLPILIQLNKRDMPYVAPIDQLLNSIHAEHLPHIEACADQGIGVFTSLRWVIDRLLQDTHALFNREDSPLNPDKRSTA